MEHDDLIPMSALQHYLYCPRQCALIHIERQWAENRFTAEGRVLHERVQQAGGERRGALRTVRALEIVSHRLGVVGVADVVEFESRAGSVLVRPVEYKRGRPKAHRADEVQLCAQALCLEEMLSCDIPEGALFYGEPRRRTIVAFDEALRALTVDIAAETRKLFEHGRTPAPAYERRKCDACSLIDACGPKRFGDPRPVARWIAGRMAGQDDIPPCDDF